MLSLNFSNISSNSVSLLTAINVEGSASNPKKVFTSESVKANPFFSINAACSLVSLPPVNCLTIRITFWYCLPVKFLILSFPKPCGAGIEPSGTTAPPTAGINPANERISSGVIDSKTLLATSGLKAFILSLITCACVLILASNGSLPIISLISSLVKFCAITVSPKLNPNGSTGINS